MSDTPETDKVEQYVLRDINRKWVLSDFAKRIERERDEARKKLEQSEILRDEIYEAAKSENERHILTAAERDDARKGCEVLREQLYRICSEGFNNNDTISCEPADDYVLRKLAELRAESAEWKRRHDNAVNMLHYSEEERSALKWRLNHCAENIGDLVAIKFATSATDADIDSAMKGDK